MILRVTNWSLHCSSNNPLLSRWFQWFLLPEGFSPGPSQVSMESAAPTPPFPPRIEKRLDTLQEALSNLTVSLDGWQRGLKRRQQEELQELLSQQQKHQQEIEKLKAHNVVHEVELKCLRERTKEQDHQIRRLKRDIRHLEADNIPPLCVLRRNIRSEHNLNRFEDHDSREEETVNQTNLLKEAR